MRETETDVPSRLAHRVARDADTLDALDDLERLEDLVLEPLVVDVPAKASDEDGAGLLVGLGGRVGVDGLGVRSELLGRERRLGRVGLGRGLGLGRVGSRERLEGRLGLLGEEAGGREEAEGSARAR